MTAAEQNMPITLLLSTQGLDLVEVSQIRVLLLRDAESRETRRPERKNKRAVLIEWGTPVLFLVSLVGLPVSFLYLPPFLLALNGLVAISILVPLTVLPFMQMWRAIRRRGVESVQWANAQAQLQDQLSAELLMYSRAALLRVADDYAGLEQSMGRRAGAVLGGSKLGFIGWSALLITGSAALSKVLTDPSLKVDSLIQQGIWWVFLLVLAVSLGALMANNSNNALLRYSDLLRGLAAAKKTAAEEAKERREALKG